MKIYLRTSLVISFLGLLGCIAALVGGVGQVEDRPPLRFDPDPFVVSFGADWSGEHDFEVAVVNDSGRPARIIGAQEFCAAACFSGVGLPTEIPAWGRGRVNLRIKTNKPGPLSNKVVFFTDQPSQPRLTMRVEGTIPETATQGVSTHTANP